MGLRPKEIRAKAERVIEASRDAFVLATVDENGLPQARVMGALMREDNFVIYLETASASRKIGQIRKNPQFQLLFYDYKTREVATISGKAKLVEDLDKKREFWEKVPGCEKYYPGYDAPEFAVIKFIPEKLEYLNLAIQPAPFEVSLAANQLPGRLE